MRQSLAHLLRSLATWIDGGESDEALRARVLNMYRLSPRRPSCDGIESLIRDNLPAFVEPVFEWSPDRRTMTMRLM